MMEVMIEIQCLRKNYRGIRGLNEFSLRVERGDLIGLVGPNGAGKSTLIKILATLLPADSGSARVAGEDVAKTPAAVRAAVGYLPDVPGVYQDMRIGEFLEFFADAFRLKEPGRGAAVARALAQAGLEERCDDFVEHLSLGWKQRLHLAKTLLHDPRVLLLDEPATGLDPLARIALREQLRQLHAAGITILISSHILADLEDICTRIVFIADGKNVNEVQPAVSPTGASSAPVHCEIEWEGAAETAERVLAAIPGAAVIEKKGNWRRIELPGGAAQASSLLRGLLDAGLSVLHFDARGPGLEERYRRTFGGRP
jgi:ABC-2 type transport system ATP-binding protein